jgi:hypothetical protein
VSSGDSFLSVVGCTTFCASGTAPILARIRGNATLRRLTLPLVQKN